MQNTLALILEQSQLAWSSIVVCTVNKINKQKMHKCTLKIKRY
jgi:hypothetical protein